MDGNWLYDSCSELKATLLRVIGRSWSRAGSTVSVIRLASCWNRQPAQEADSHRQDDHSS